MLKHFIQKALGRKTFEAQDRSLCSQRVTEVEKKAVEDATLSGRRTRGFHYRGADCSSHWCRHRHFPVPAVI